MAVVPQYENKKLCPVCEREMNPQNAWWWTDQGAACSETCARVLTEGKA